MSGSWCIALGVKHWRKEIRGAVWIDSWQVKLILVNFSDVINNWFYVRIIMRITIEELIAVESLAMRESAYWNRMRWCGGCRADSIYSSKFASLVDSVISKSENW